MNTKKLLIVSILLGCILGITSGFHLFSFSLPPAFANVIPNGFAVLTQPGNPRRLQIKKLGVDTTIEPVGKDSSGRMAVPQNIFNAGWYDLGVRPGERGNAVIDGHVNTPKLTENIFTHLADLEPGDIVSVIDDRGQTRNFEVKEIADVPISNFPIDEIFGDTTKIRLNLISCSGTWEHNVQDYSNRTVVFTELVR